MEIPAYTQCPPVFSIERRRGTAICSRSGDLRLGVQRGLAADESALAVQAAVQHAAAAAPAMPNIKLRVHDDYSLMSMIERGMGVSILTEWLL